MPRPAVVPTKADTKAESNGVERKSDETTSTNGATETPDVESSPVRKIANADSKCELHTSDGDDDDAANDVFNTSSTGQCNGQKRNAETLTAELRIGEYRYLFRVGFLTSTKLFLCFASVRPILLVKNLPKHKIDANMICINIYDDVNMFY